MINFSFFFQWLQYINKVPTFLFIQLLIEQKRLRTLNWAGHELSRQHGLAVSAGPLEQVSVLVCVLQNFVHSFSAKVPRRSDVVGNINLLLNFEIKLEVVF